MYLEEHIEVGESSADVLPNHFIIHVHVHIVILVLQDAKVRNVLKFINLNFEDSQRL